MIADFGPLQYYLLKDYSLFVSVGLIIYYYSFCISQNYTNIQFIIAI